MSSKRTLALVDKLVRSFLTGDDNLSNFIDDLSDDQVEDLIGSIEIYARQDPATLINVIKTLLNQTRTRHDTVLKCVQLIQEELIRDKECFQCMSELHLALLSYKLSDHEQASTQIEELVKLIMQPMMELSDNKSGITTTLDLLPSLLTLASLSKNALNESQRILDAILDSPLSSKVIALSNVLIDMQLTTAQIGKLQQRMLEYASKIEAAEFAGMVKNTINFVEKSNNPVQWISILREILKNIPVSELQIVLYILDISLQHNESFPLSIIQYYNDSLKQNNALEMNLSDLFLLLLLIKSEKHREMALRIISKLFTVATSNGFEAALALMMKMISFQGIEMQSNLILKLALYLCEKQQPQKVRTLGHVTLIELFKRHSTSRADILSLCFSLIFEENSSENKQISVTSREFCQTLELIAKNHLSLLSEFLTKIQDWLGYLPNYPLPLSKRLLVLFLPLAQVNPQFYDSLLKLFRKFLILKVKDTKILGVHGVCQLLSHNILRKSMHSGSQSHLNDDEIELLALIKQGLSISIEARSDVYTSILLLVKNTYFCKGSAKVEILKRIRAILLAKLKRFQKDNEQGVLCMEKCFEDMKSQGVRERENILYLIGALLATILSLKHSNVESPRTIEYIVELINQVGNLKEMMALARIYYNREDDVEAPLLALVRHNTRSDDEEEYSELNWLDAPSSHLVQVIKNSASMTCDPFKIPSEHRLALLIPILGLLIDLLYQMPSTFDKYGTSVDKVRQALFDEFSFLVVKNKSAQEPESISMATVSNLLKEHIALISRKKDPYMKYFTLHSTLLILERKLSFWTKNLIELHSASLGCERFLSQATTAIGFLSLTALQVQYLPLMGGLEMSGYEFGEDILMNLLSNMFNLFKHVHSLEDDQVDASLDLLNKLPEESKVKLDGNHAKYSVLQTCLAMIGSLLTVALAATQEPINLLSLALTEDENGRPIRDWLHVPDFDEDKIVLGSIRTKEPVKNSKKKKNSKTKEKTNGVQKRKSNVDINERPNKRQKVIEDNAIPNNNNAPAVMFSFSATALYFAKYLVVQIEQGLPSSLMKVYLALIEQLCNQHLSVGGEKDTNITHISLIYIWILKRYPIETGMLVKSMLAFAMDNTTSLNEKMTMASEIVETCLDINATEDDEDKLQVAGSNTTKQAAMAVVAALFESVLANMIKPAYLQENMSSIMIMYKTFKDMLNTETDMRSIALSSLRKLLALAEKLCRLSTTAVKTMKSTAIVEQIFDEDNHDVTLLEFLQELKSVTVAAHAWTNKNRANLTKLNAKKVPMLLFQIETLDVTLLKFVHSRVVPEELRDDVANIFGASNGHADNNGDMDQDSASDVESGQDVIDEEIDETMLEDLMQDKPVRRSKKKKRSLRSRNPYIDDQLAVDVEAEDDYADLEDWIVVKKGKSYS